ncbi:bifunctional adenosylcobinamide kinase/adenosylcobinamide-phosphate guanylyltransferase [Alteromonadaceae bacterium BrNp21-10]|nr:bifunctional adenosylcobinamide kinase/adenosylcobinamide-phosphate guanylyltransferase [Alteromonadaceae bacterium BrNp21-10]
MIHLILGGARSGKSSFAEQQALVLSNLTQQKVTYVATATNTDNEMAQRIARHQAERPAHWLTAEVPMQLSEWIAQQASGVVIIDCLTLWLNNQLYNAPQQDFSLLSRQLCQVLRNSKADIFLVSNEVGMGVIPLGEVSRQFVDQAGWLNQAVAKVADNVTLIAAGLPLPLKTAGQQP